MMKQRSKDLKFKNSFQENIVAKNNQDVEVMQDKIASKDQKIL